MDDQECWIITSIDIGPCSYLTFISSICISYIYIYVHTITWLHTSFVYAYNYIHIRIGPRLISNPEYIWSCSALIFYSNKSMKYHASAQVLLLWFRLVVCLVTALLPMHYWCLYRVCPFVIIHAMVYLIITLPPMHYWCLYCVYPFVIIRTHDFPCLWSCCLRMLLMA